MQATELAALLKGQDLASHVNLIPWNPVDDTEFKRPSKVYISKFKEVLESKGVTCSVRMTRGKEASAACGQLRNEFQKSALAEFSVPL